VGRLKESWWEREEIKKVTMDYVKTNCKITNRERELLQIIKDRKLVRRDMLEIISPHYRHLGSSRTRIMNRSIKKLFKNMCIDKVHESQGYREGNTPAIVSLDRAGSLILGIPHRPRIKQLNKRVNGIDCIIRQLPINYRHINGVNNIEVETILYLEEECGEIVDWIHEEAVKFHYGQEKVVIIPDVIMSLKFSDKHSKTFHAFLEYDTGTESIRYKEPKIIREKIIKYRQYKNSHLWENDYHSFPIVLFVTEDESRVTFFNDKCEENGVSGLGIYRDNYIKVIKKLATLIK
jgi:hypothetical protein